jgi:hypothetical protein
VCEKCLIIDINTIYRRENEQNGQIEMTHICSSQRLNDAQQKLKPDKDKIITNLYEKLPEVMKKKVNSWTNNQTRIVAAEVPSSHTATNNCFDLSSTNQNH